MKGDDARKRARSILNYREPQHPPDIYYIRRTPDLLNRFLHDDEEMNKVVENVPENLKHNYEIFKL